MRKIIDVFSLLLQLMVVDFAFVKEVCYAWVIMCMQVCCGMFWCMNVHIYYIYHLRNTHTVMFNEMYVVTYTTDCMKAQSRFSTVSRLTCICGKNFSNFTIFKSLIFLSLYASKKHNSCPQWKTKDLPHKSESLIFQAVLPLYIPFLGLALCSWEDSRCWTDTVLVECRCLVPLITNVIFVHSLQLVLSTLQAYIHLNIIFPVLRLLVYILQETFPPKFCVHFLFPLSYPHPNTLYLPKF